MAGRWRDGTGEGAGRQITNLGHVDSREAADFLLDLAADAQFRAGEDAILPATLAADAVVWPRLLELARDRRLLNDTREQAVFWLGQEAADEATEGLAQIVDSDDDIEVRKHAVFALSQRPNGEAIPLLIMIARTHQHPEIKRQAFFWLADSEDPRAIEFFAEVLSGG